MDKKLLYRYLLIIMFLACQGFSALAQSRSFIDDLRETELLRGTEIIISVDPRTNGVNEIFLKKHNLEQQLYDLKAACYRCDFYLGTAEGNITLKGDNIIEGRNCKFIINTLDNLMPGKEFLPGSDFPPGTPYSLAGIETTVVNNSKGVFIVESH